MQKVLIVDDEPMIRFGIKASVDWEAEGCEIAGDCANGVEALARMEVTRVDILITDIKMPVMDGLTLIRHVRDRSPHTKVILVSSHNDFDYVREGLKLGVVDYILKHTLEPEELLSILRTCKSMLEEEATRLDAAEDRRYSEELLKRKTYEHELKRYLVEGTEPDTGGPPWLSDSFMAVHVVLGQQRQLEESYGYLHMSIVLEQMVEVFYGRHPEGVGFPTAENGVFYLFPGGAGESERQLIQLKAALEAETGVRLTLGYEVGCQSESLKACFQHSRDIGDLGFFKGEGIYRYQAEAVVVRTGCHLPSLITSSVVPTDEQLAAVLARWRAEWAEGGISPMVLKEEACRVISSLFSHTTDSYALVEVFEGLFKAETLDALCGALKERISDLRRYAYDRMDTPVSASPVDKAINYIHAHYVDSLTLQEVADAVHVSKNYFSILFKKTTGHNFIDYVIDLRIQKAKELLQATDLKIYEVAERSGTSDVKYFSKLFKKITGWTPNEYREQHRSASSGHV